MTREEAINTLKENCCAICAYGSQDMDSCDIRSCDNRDAIKALEQEPIIILDELKEIREEINNLQTYKLFSGDTELYLSKDDVKAILDKRISELEGKNV